MGFIEGSTLAFTSHLTHGSLLISVFKSKAECSPVPPLLTILQDVPGFSVQSLNNPPLGLAALEPSNLLGIAALPAFSPTQTLWTLVASCNASHTWMAFTWSLSVLFLVATASELHGSF